MTSVLLVSACGGLASRARASVLATAALSSLLLAPASLAATMTQEQVDGSPATVAPATTSDTSGSFALNGIPTTGVDSPPGAADAPGALSGAMITLSVIAVAVVVMGVLVVIVARRRRPSVMRAGSVAGGVRPEARLKDLTSITGSNEIVVTENVVVLGRLRSNSGPGVQGVTLPINTVGRRHAQIEYRLHAYYVLDLQSRNGTLVNGVKITEPTILHDGDVILIEGVQFVFMLPVEGVGDETQWVGSRADSPSASITVAPGFEAPGGVDAGSRPGGGLISMYGGDDTSGAGANRAIATEVAAPAVARGAGLIDSYLNDAEDGATATDGSFGYLLDDLDEGESSDAPTAVLPEGADLADAGLVGAHAQGDVAAVAPASPGVSQSNASSGSDADPVGDPVPTPTRPASLIAQHTDEDDGGADDTDTGDPAPIATIPVAPVPAAPPPVAQLTPATAPKASLIAQYADDAEYGDANDAATAAFEMPSPVASRSVDAPRAQTSAVAPSTVNVPSSAAETGAGLIAAYRDADDDVSAEAATSWSESPELAPPRKPGDTNTDDRFDSLLDGPHEDVARAGSADPYADTRDEDTYADYDDAPRSPPPRPASDLEDTGKSHATEREYLVAQGLIAPENLPAAVPDIAHERAHARSPPAPTRAAPTPPKPAPVAAPEEMPLAFLFDLDGGTESPEYRIQTDNLFVGRSVPTQVHLRTYLSIPSKTIGRKHASIRYARGRFWIEDHKSVNGTFVNAERVIGMAPLESGDEVTFDTYRFNFIVMPKEKAQDADEDRTVFSGGH